MRILNAVVVCVWSVVQLNVQKHAQVKTFGKVNTFFFLFFLWVDVHCFTKFLLFNHDHSISWDPMLMMVACRPRDGLRGALKRSKEGNDFKLERVERRRVCV